MNVVVLNDFPDVRGGGDRVAIAGAREMAERGHRVIYYSAIPGPVDEVLGHPSIHVVLGHGRDISKSPGLSSIFLGVWNREHQRALRGLLHDCAPHETVVHIHNYSKSLTSAPIRTSLDLGYPTLLALHDYLVACPTGAFFDHGRAAICPLRPLSAACICRSCDSRGYPQKLWRVGRQLIQQHAGRVPAGFAKVIVPSHRAARTLKPYLPASTQVEIVAYPIENRPIGRSPAEDSGRIVFCGRLVAEKGPFLFAKAVERAGFEGELIGQGPLRDQLLAENPRLTCTGWLDKPAILSRLQQARAMVFPSLWNETFGLVVAECLALGIPAIVSDATGAAELIVEDVNGYTFRSGDFDDLVAKLNLLHDNQRVRRLSAGAYERYWADPLTVERYGQHLENIYHDLLASR
jgi:glycosyltransferase involved in cell wall biosynthesis